ncbi:MAG: hypothetical protein V2I57_12965 [Xanthomonadales bacterium]|nr:hypothetical protein [Xanthomonadales bacterium]
MIILFVLLLLAWKFWPEPEPMAVEDTVIGEPVKRLQEAQQFEDQVLEEAEARKQRLEAAIDDDSG